MNLNAYLTREYGLIMDWADSALNALDKKCQDSVDMVIGMHGGGYISSLGLVLVGGESSPFAPALIHTKWDFATGYTLVYADGKVTNLILHL